MFSRKLPSGVVIQLTESDAHTGPNREYGQRCGRAIWFRCIPDCDALWKQSNWRSMLGAREWLECCEDSCDWYEGEKLQGLR